MIDRALGVIGLALSVLFAFLPHFYPTVSDGVARGGVLVGVFLLGMSVALLFAHRGTKARAKPVPNALLRLHMYSDQRLPDALKTEHIFRYYVLRQGAVAVGADGSQTQVFTTTTIFVSFEPDVLITTLKVRSPDMALPQFEVKEFNQRFAIVVFAGHLADGTVELAVES